MSYESIRFETADGVATITLNRPEKLNAYTVAMGEEAVDAFRRARADEAVRAVILTGAGRAFSAGGDMGMLREKADQGAARPGHAHRDIRDTMRAFYTLFLSVRELPCPTIAALNGAAVGAGLCVALACDLRLASREAKLGLNFTALGVHPGMGATWTLPRLVGPARAAELLYTSRLVTGEEAAQIGLVNRALPPERVLPAARELAAEIASTAPLASRGVKRALARSPLASLEDQLSFEAAEQALCFETADAREGLAALAERRPPKFEGR